MRYFETAVIGAIQLIQINNNFIWVLMKASGRKEKRELAVYHQPLPLLVTVNPQKAIKDLLLYQELNR